MPCFACRASVDLDEAEIERFPESASFEDALLDCLTRASNDWCGTGCGKGRELPPMSASAAARYPKGDRAAGCSCCPTPPRQFQQRIERRLADLLGRSAGSIRSGRLQEAAILADRTDISEELQRLKAHADRLLEMLKAAANWANRSTFWLRR